MLGGGTAVWRGQSAAYPTDARNRLGYFERRDVVRLNYDTLRDIVGQAGWTQFASDFAAHPAILNFSAGLDRSRRAAAGLKRAKFDARARPILADMASRRAPFVLKDVRFSRTLPLWAPLLRERAFGLTLACVVPFRHPFEVEHSSITGGDRIALWRHYMLSALTSARSVCGTDRTFLVEYNAWFDAKRAAAQHAALLSFLQCAGLPIAAGPAAKSIELVHASERHHNASAATFAAHRALPPPAACLLRELQSGNALRWSEWDAARQGFASTPCPTGQGRRARAACADGLTC